MAALWPWLVVAGLGALHGLNPIGGWAWAAGCGLRSRDPKQAWRALGPIALGHFVSVGLVALAVPAALSLGLAVGSGLLLVAVLGLMAFAVLHGARCRRGVRTGLTLVSFLVSTAQGSGLMLMPALVPLCIGEGAVREITATGSLVRVLAAVGLHASAMLAVTGLLSIAACAVATWSRRAAVRPDEALRHPGDACTEGRAHHERLNQVRHAGLPGQRVAENQRQCQQVDGRPVTQADAGPDQDRHPGIEPVQQKDQQQRGDPRPHHVLREEDGRRRVDHEQLGHLASVLMNVPSEKRFGQGAGDGHGEGRHGARLDGFHEKTAALHGRHFQGTGRATGSSTLPSHSGSDQANSTARRAGTA
jgi:hypothetical protein